MTIHWMELDSLDTSDQTRVTLNDAYVQQYLDNLSDAVEGDNDTWPFPPLVVFYDGETMRLSAGYHRHLACRLKGWSTCPVEIRHGDQVESTRYSMTSNTTAPRTPEDVYKGVVMMHTLQPDWSQRTLAKACGVSHATVNRILLKANAESPPDGKDSPDDSPEIVLPEDDVVNDVADELTPKCEHDWDRKDVCKKCGEMRTEVIAWHDHQKEIQAILSDVAALSRRVRKLAHRPTAASWYLVANRHVQMISDLKNDIAAIEPVAYEERVITRMEWEQRKDGNM